MSSETLKVAATRALWLCVRRLRAKGWRWIDVANRYDEPIGALKALARGPCPSEPSPHPVAEAIKKLRAAISAMPCARIGCSHEPGQPLGQLPRPCRAPNCSCAGFVRWAMS